MAKSSAKKGVKRTWIRYLVMILFGGGSGIGGWQFKDHPALQGVYRMVTGHDPTEDKLTVKSALREVADVLHREDPFRKAGDFEVVVASLELEDSAYRKGQTVDLQVRLIKKGTSGRDTTLWDSRTTGENPVKVGLSGMKTDWSDDPITVSWKPGDRYSIEVWDQRRLFPKKLMEWSGSDDQAFPLKSGTLALAKSDGQATDSNASRIVLESKPKADVFGSVATKHDDSIKIR